MSAQPLSPAPAPARIVVRGVNWLGDAIMSLPGLQRLREAHPAAEITLLTPAKLAGLWERHPHLDRVIAFEAGENPWRVARRLREGAFDLALVFPNSVRSALEVFLARIPRRVGFARRGRGMFLTRAVPRRAGTVVMRKRSVREIRRMSAGAGLSAPAGLPRTAHHVFDYLELAAAVGAKRALCAPQLPMGPEEVGRVQTKFFAGSGDDLPWFGLNAGAEYGPAKRWPVERFIGAAGAINRQRPCGWLVLGGPGDQELCGQLEAGLRGEGLARVLNLAGKTTLRELAALLKLCKAVLTNDTGPMHLAAAVGTPVVGIFGSTSPELTGPGSPGAGSSSFAVVRAGVACAPCFRRECPIDFRCMQGVSVEEVVRAVARVSGKW